jgi:arginyl-tRNA synthetase
MLTQDPLRLKVVEKLSSALQKLTPEFTSEEIYSSLVLPPNPDLGHLAFGCFILAKKLKKPPQTLAQELTLLLATDSDLLTATAAGPYINFKFPVQVLFASFLSIQKILDSQNALTSKKFKIMIEYSQPNTHKELHVGHMRNLCLGHALVQLQRKLYGHDQVISSTFPGDVGTHVAKCLWYIKNFITNDELEKKRHSPDRGEWLGQMYSTANLKLEDEEKTEKYEQNKAHLTEILRQLEKKQGPFFELWKETRQWSIELMNRVYQWAGVEFDRWYWESEVDADSVQTVKKYLAEGKLQQSQGAVGYDLESEKLGFCMLLKSDGTGLYATKDLELARRKFQDFGVDQSLYIVDQRQNLHFKQVFRILEILGFPQAKNCLHLPYNFVELPDGAMSSRKGNIIPLMQLVEQMKQTIKSQFLNKYKNEWPPAEIELVANQVASGAIKYGMIRQDSNKKIVFEMSEWLKVEGESGPFIQYSAARINSLIQKFGKPEIQSDYAKLLTHPSEEKLLNHLSQFMIEIQYAALNYKPASLCTYLYELSKRFNGFYHDCSIGQAETPNLQKARLVLCQFTLYTLTSGLSLLGIPVPQRM